MTDFYAQYITRTTFDPDTHSVKNKVDEAVTKNTTKNQHTKTPKMEVEPTEIPEQKMRKCPVTGKMIPVDEKLTGDQHKLDHNKDHKIDAHDMKMVRKKGAVKDHPMGEEIGVKVLRKGKEVKPTPKIGVKKLVGGKEVKTEDDENLKEYGLLRASKKSPVSKEGMSMTALRARRAANPIKPVKTGEIIRSKTGTSTLNRNSVNANRNKMSEDVIEEMTFKVQVEGLPTMYIDGGSSGAIKSKLRKKFKDPKAVISIERITSAEKKKELRAKVMDEDSIEEISKNTIGAYVAGAEKDKIKKYAQSDQGKISKADAYKNQQKRNRGIELAKSKMKPARVPASEEKVDEISKKTAASYINKAQTDTYGQGIRSGLRIAKGDTSYGSSDRKVKNRGVGTMRAVNRLAGAKKTSEDKVDEKFANAAQQAAAMAAIKASGKYKKKSESVNEVKQDKDVKSMPGTQPAKYYKGVSKSVKDDRAAHFASKSKMSDSNPAAYKKAPGDAGAKTKPSKATLQVRKMMGEKAQDKSIAGKAKASGMPAGVLKKVFNRGMAAYKTGHRPGTSQHQWAHARVNAFIKKGKGTWGGADKDLAAQVKGSKKESVGESLWANIHAKRARIKAGSGEKMRKVGSKGAPTPDQMKKAQGK